MKAIFISLLLFILIGQVDAQESRYTVYLFLGEDCKICQYYTPTLKELHNDYASDSLSFIGLFPNRSSTASGVVAFKDKHDIPFEMKLEYFATKTKAFDVTITPEVVVYDNQNEEILYKGRIDDSYHKLGRRRQVVTSTELEEVLKNLVTGEKVDVPFVTPIGCYITFR